MKYQDEQFGKKALALGYLTSAQWEEYHQAWEKGTKNGVDISFLLMEEKILTPQQVQLIAEKLKEEEIPEKIGEYKILECLGKGGMASVFKAQKKANEWFAIKVMDRGFSEDEEQMKRFFREVQSVLALDHPLIMKAFDYGADVDQGLCFVVLEYIEGRNLKEIVEKEGPLPLPVALQIVQDVARALEHAWGKKIIHRDIKPENILLTEQNKIKVADFGLAKQVGSDGITQTGEMLGTPYYMAPEVSQGEKNLTVQTDIYSLGITLFYLLAGRPPFYEGNAMQVILQHVMEPIPSLSEIRPDITPDLLKGVDSIIEIMAAKPPQERPSPKELIRRLGLLLGKSGAKTGQLLAPQGAPAKPDPPVSTVPTAPMVEKNHSPPGPPNLPSSSPIPGTVPSARGRMKPMARKEVSFPVKKEEKNGNWLWMAGVGIALILLCLMLLFFVMKFYL